MTNHLIELDGDLARTRTYMHLLSTDFSIRHTRANPVSHDPDQP